MRAAVMLALALAIATGCADVAPLTEVLVTVESELSVPAELAVVELVVYDETQSHELVRRSFDAAPRSAEVPKLAPFSVSLIPEGTRLDWFHLRALGKTRAADGSLHEVVWFRTTARFTPGRTTPLRVELSPACVGRPCGATQSCDPRTGSCVSLADPAPETDGRVLDAGSAAERADGDAARPEAPSREASAPATDADLGRDAERAPCSGETCDASPGAAPDAASATPSEGGAPDGGPGAVDPTDAAASEPVRSDSGARDAGQLSEAGAPRDAGQASDGGRPCRVDSDCRRPEICDHTQAPPVCMPRLNCPNCDLRYNRCDVAFAPGGCVGQATPCTTKLPVCTPKLGDNCAAERCDVSEFCCASCYCTPRGQSCLPVQCPL